MAAHNQVCVMIYAGGVTLDDMTNHVAAMFPDWDVGMVDRMNAGFIVLISRSNAAITVETLQEINEVVTGFLAALHPFANNITCESHILESAHPANVAQPRNLEQKHNAVEEPNVAQLRDVAQPTSDNPQPIVAAPELNDSRSDDASRIAP